MKNLLFLLVLFSCAYLAAETTLQVTDLGTTTIPYAFDYSQQIEDNNIVFYREEVTTSYISYYTFTYDSYTNTFSEETLAGQVSNDFGVVAGTPCDYYLHFGYLYIAYQPDDCVVIFRVGQNDFQCQAITGITLASYIFYACEVVTPDIFVLVLEGEVVSYNIVTGDSRQLLTFTTDPYVYYQPEIFRVDDEHFVFDIDASNGEGTDTWYLFSSSDLLLQQTMIYNQPYSSVSMMDGREASCDINGYFYLFGSDNLLRSGGVLYECSWVNGAIHTYLYGINSSDYAFFKVNQFGNDMVLVPTAFGEGGGVIFAFQSPVQNNPEYAATYVVPNLPFVTAQFTPEIVADVWRADGNIHVRLLWRPHYLDNTPYYVFPEEGGDSTVKAAYVVEDNLLVLTNAHLYRYFIEEVVSNDDHNATPSINHLAVFPNPVHSGMVLNIATDALNPGTVDIFNVKGQVVRSYTTKGENNISWDTRDRKGRPVTTGVYFVRYQSGNNSAVKRFIYIQ